MQPGLSCALLAAAALAGCSATASGDASQQTAAPDAGPSQADLMALVKYMTPGPQHASFARLAGDWNVSGQYWTSAGAAPQPTSGTSEFKLQLGGRYLVETYSGTGPLGAFHGLGITAFNNETQQYEMVWLDDLGTGVMSMSGDGHDGVATLHADITDALTHQLKHLRAELRTPSDDERTLDMYTTHPGQPEFRSLSLHYTRARR